MSDGGYRWLGLYRYVRGIAQSLSGLVVQDPLRRSAWGRLAGARVRTAAPLIRSSLVPEVYGLKVARVNRDIITIGGSAGSVEVLLGMVGELPSDMSASLFVAIHTLPTYRSALPQLLSSRGPLPASHPVHAEEIKPGHIYVAPPDNHILVRQGFMDVVRGPRENGHRPAVDALFRTAAASYGSRVIAVVLSGYLDCGTAGMLSVKARGGLGVVQDPESALAPDMPRSVLSHLEVDHVVHPLELPGLLKRLVATSAGPARPIDEVVSRVEGTAPGNRAELVCPTCQGVLTETHSGQFQHFRCHVGHAFSLESLVSEQSEELERALWAAVRALEESSSLSERLSRTQGIGLSARFAEKAATQREQAGLIQQILLHGNRLGKEDIPDPPQAHQRTTRRSSGARAAAKNVQIGAGVTAPTAKVRATKKTAAKKPTAKKPTAEKPTAEKPTAKKPTAKKPAPRKSKPT